MLERYDATPEIWMIALTMESERKSKEQVQFLALL
jgi:hypothetical protein